MPHFLYIESSSHNCSVAVGTATEILAIQEEASNQYVHSEKLHVFIKEVMATAKLDFADLNAVCVGRGPGSYTGLRIGVSAAKGLCFSLNIPLISIDSLTVLASQLFHQVGGFIVPLMDARRMEVYQAVFSETGEMIGEIEAKILDENSYATELSNLFTGGDNTQMVRNIGRLARNEDGLTNQAVSRINRALDQLVIPELVNHYKIITDSDGYKSVEAKVD